MGRFSHRKAIFLSGLIWFSVGGILLAKGVAYLSKVSLSTALLLGIVGAILGMMKAHFVLRNTVNRVIRRILTKKPPLRVTELYSLSYFFLLFGMMLLGFVFKSLPIDIRWKGAIDIGVGFALVTGSLLYFQQCLKLKVDHL